MIKLIRRKEDKKYLKSAESDNWVDGVSDAFEMTYNECEQQKVILSGKYTSDQISEVVNFNKSKEISAEEKQQLLDILKSKINQL
jgi:hypothetical protein